MDPLIVVGVSGLVALALFYYFLAKALGPINDQVSFSKLFSFIITYYY